MMKRWMALSPLLVLFAIGFLASASQVWAQEEAATVSPAVSTATDAAEPREAQAALIDYRAPEWDLAYTINTLIMFLCAVLVLLMQAGFAMVEVGLNSQKNTVNILFKNLMDLCIGVLLYLFVGWSLMYHTADKDLIGGWLGYDRPMVQRDAQLKPDGTYESNPNDDGKGGPKYATTADFLFQVAFAATAATIVSGAVAGRLKFSAYLLYSAFLTGLIYPISGYWKWGGGALAGWGFQDFAGSVVVHAVGGFAGLAGALALGPRIGRFGPDGSSRPIPGHNLTFAALGVFVLWIGWYGFNPGSQLFYSGISNVEATVYIALTTTFAAAAGSIASMAVAWAMFGKPDLTMALNGALAGLVGITANCDRVSQIESIAIGAIAGVLVVLGIIALERLKIDDPVGAFPVHGICGVWGGLATGIFGDLPKDITTRGQFFLVQLQSTAIIVAWAFLTMAALFFGLKACGMLRVTAEEEIEGLDLGEHGMQAYVNT